MAYEVTATRRRPQRFEDMIGQDFVVATLQKSIAAGKIAHAYLFSGPRGCGKTSSARILAKALNCEQGPGGTPCGVCSACTEITRGSSLDVIEIDGASNTSVNDVRQIKDEVQFPPNSCRYKVYIIDEVHMLSTSAFNALLKTIEEPPPYVIFIFATTELHKVPATIKSRCQQFNFRLVPVELLKDSLAIAAGESGIRADDEALFWIAREATGSVRDAYTLFDQVAAFSDGHITFDKIRDKLGLVGVDRINPVVEACAEGDGQTALTLLDDILQNGVSVEQFTVDVGDYFRNLLLIKSGIVKESLLGQHADRFSQKVLASWSSVQIERALGIMLQLFRDIRYSLDPRYELELAVSRLSWISDYVSPSELKSALAQARSLLQKGSSGSSPMSGATPAPALSQANAPVSPTPRNGSGGGDSGPFSEADRSSDDGKQTVRESDPDERIEDPFAALKERIGGGFAASFSVQPVVSPPVQQVPVQPGNAQPVQVQAMQTQPVQVQSANAQPVQVQAALAQPANMQIQPAPSAETPAPAAVVTAETATPAPVAVSAAEGIEPPSNAIPFSQLQESLVSRFQATNNMVATSLSQAFDWKEEGSVVKFSVDRPFVHNFLEQDHKLIADAVSHLLGRLVGVEINLDASRLSGGKGNVVDEGIPEQVEMIRQMFRGTIAGEG